MSGAAWAGPTPTGPTKWGRLTLYGMVHLLALPKRDYLVKGLVSPREDRTRWRERAKARRALTAA